MSFPVGPEASPRIAIGRAQRVSAPRRLAVAVALLFGLTSVVAYANPTHTFAWDAESFSSASEADLVTLTNRSRANAGLSALKVDSVLTSVARWRSKDMIERDYFSHTIPGYGKVWDKLKAVGYCYHLGGENIGWNNYPDDIATAAIHSMFMGSEGHHENIMGKDWDHIGVGAYKGADGRKMWTVLFADKCGSTAPKPTPKPTPRPTAKPKPKPTAHPTSRPTPQKTSKPKATPAPTATIETPDAQATPPLGDSDFLSSGDPSDLGATDGTESPEPADDTAAAVGMRVIDRPVQGGLLDTIVGGVTGFFFGG